MADQIPEEAIEAAADVVALQVRPGIDWEEACATARLVLMAAAPAIREAERERMRAGLHDLIMGPVWQWCISMVPEANTTYGVDAVGKCAELVQQWPDIDPEALARIRHGDRMAPVIEAAVKAERERIAKLAKSVQARYRACTEADHAMANHGDCKAWAHRKPFADLIRERL